MYNKNLSVILVIIFSFLVLAGCGGGGSDINLYNVVIKVNVLDYWSELPVKNALISIDSKIIGSTNSNGIYQDNQLVTENSTLTIGKTGYITEFEDINATEDDEIITFDFNLKLMDNVKDSGSISGNIMMGNNLSIASADDVYDQIKVMATYKEKTPDEIIYTIYSDITNVNSDGTYEIEHARIYIPLTIIGFIDNNNDNSIDDDEFFGEHDAPDSSPIILTPSEPHKDDVDIFMTPDYFSLQSTENKKIIFQKPSKGE